MTLPEVMPAVYLILAFATFALLFALAEAIERLN
jgi:hypothetical protein